MPDGAWDLEEVLQEEVRPLSGEGRVNADEGVTRSAGQVRGRKTWGECER